ncbi:endonuclease/exonuclease/phosphatase family protein [Nocardioides coralli]|uniref:endonuclease/exonuclease/phosphatase family protein n=1 Tax=Nocardioides coralli TaxID=2872154 RepID=UPI001CA3BCDA|nr:endonuclease/exonuclease/phosphatase family protein [Nocardioides coralli]QZY30038.1 hypothetical protein K6T13_04965 [Nocardioides coralli]
MPGSRKRVQPRHADVTGQPVRRSRRAGLLGGAALALVGLVAAQGLAGGVVGDAIAALGGPGAGDREALVVSDPARPTTASGEAPEATAGTMLRPRFRVVDATRLKPAPEEPKRAKLAERVERQSATQDTIPEFGVAMINILGSNHTQGGKGGYAPGVNRAYTATRMLLAQGVSIIGFSEIQTDQLGVFRRNAPSFAVYPGTALGGKGVPQSVAWDTRVWSLVEATEIYIPFSGQIRPQPVVKLAHTGTGTEIWVMNVHNSPHRLEGERDRAETIEISKLNELIATGVPVVVTGDFNEKQEVLCRITASTGLQSAVGGGNCYPPPQQMRVDWIFASPAFAVESYRVTRDAPVPSITDHAVLYSRLSLS